MSVMAAIDREGLVSTSTSSQLEELYQLQVYAPGRALTVHVYNPDYAFRSSRLASDEYRSQLIVHARSIVRDYGLAEDVVQTSLLSAYCKLNDGKLYAIRFDDGKWDTSQFPEGYLLIRGGNFILSGKRKWMDIMLIRQLLDGKETEEIEIIEQPLAWLKKIVENNAIKLYKKRKRYREFCENPANWSQAEDPRCLNPEKMYLQQEEHASLREIVAALPARYRDIVVLRFFATEEYSFQDIATRLQRPVHTVTKQSSRAINMVGEAVKGERSVVNHSLTRKKRLA
jgi:RNA polymerase sigma factor (sigma-70 family)